MGKALTIAKEKLLSPFGLEEAHLGEALSQLMGPSIDDGDVFMQYARHESWAIEDGLVKEAGFGIDQGVGVRAVSGEKTGFAYSDEIALPALLDASRAARRIARAGDSGQVRARGGAAERGLYAVQDPMADLGDADKVELLQSIDRMARAADGRVRQVMASLTGEHEVMMVAAADGTLTADVRPLVRLNVSVIVEQDGRREQGGAGAGGRYGYDVFVRRGTAKSLVDEAVRQALLNLEAVAAPAGNMVVVLGPGWPGVLLHEAVGHGLEGDFGRKGTSAFSGRLGERVASRGVTVVDDGTLKHRRGSLNVDDEGTPTQCTTLIEDGILKGFMQDKMNARLMGVPVTGNGRRESYSHLPMPRMTNTYMLAGAHDPAEIIASVKKGFYAVNFGGGQVDITSGQFVFSASEAYLIENGKVTTPVKGATLIGYGPKVLTRVSMIGDDLQLDDGIGTCGKQGQMVPVGVGQPTLRIDGLTVGGVNA